MPSNKTTRDLKAKELKKLLGYSQKKTPRDLGRKLAFGKQLDYGKKTELGRKLDFGKSLDLGNGVDLD